RSVGHHGRRLAQGLRLADPDGEGRVDRASRERWGGRRPLAEEEAGDVTGPELPRCLGTAHLRYVRRGDGQGALDGSGRTKLRKPLLVEYLRRLRQGEASAGA